MPKETKVASAASATSTNLAQPMPKQEPEATTSIGKNAPKLEPVVKTLASAPPAPAPRSEVKQSIPATRPVVLGPGPPTASLGTNVFEQSK
jgi:hypothetical protein